jgi:cell division protein FtsI/penicillin-binding protein 2
MQILVGEIDRSTAEPSVHFHPFRLEADYIYPASAIKTLGALAALQTYAELRQEFPSLGLDTAIEFSGLATSHQDALGEPVVVSVEDRSTLREEIERALIVSSNEGFNRLWDLAGHEGINQRAWDAGLRSVRMRHRLSRQGRPEEAHRLAPSIRAEIDGQWVELLPQRESGLVVEDNSHPDVLIGRAHIAALTDDLVAEPLDFSAKNATSLLDLLSLVAWVAEPALVPHVDLGLSEPDREFLLEIMSYIPDEAERFKPFSPGVLSTVDLGSLTYVNKAGRAYGFHLDAAYIRDEATGRDFLLAASLHTNPNGVMNDSRYAYEDVSFPFLVALGAAVTERLIR